MTVATACQSAVEYLSDRGTFPHVTLIYKSPCVESLYDGTSCRCATLLSSSLYKRASLCELADSALRKESEPALRWPQARPRLCQSSQASHSQMTCLVVHTPALRCAYAPKENLGSLQICYARHNEAVQQHKSTAHPVVSAQHRFRAGTLCRTSDCRRTSSTPCIRRPICRLVHDGRQVSILAMHSSDDRAEYPVWWPMLVGPPPGPDAAATNQGGEASGLHRSGSRNQQARSAGQSASWQIW